MAGGLAANRATISARGGTTGRATGCPARFGLAGGRSGLPPPTGAPACAGAAGPGRSAGRGGAGMDGTAPGRGTPGTSVGAATKGETLAAGAGFSASTTSGGSGCLGPDKICPGLGAGGAVRVWIMGPRLTGILGSDGSAAGGGTGPVCAVACSKGGVSGCPVARGGRRGNVGRIGAAGGSAGAGCLATVSATGAAPLFCGIAGSAAVTGAAGDITLGSAGGRSIRGAAGSPSSPAAIRWRSFSATSSSSELECVFLSATPSSSNRSRRTLGLTSSSRASSLIRILLIHETPKPNFHSRDLSARPFFWNHPA